MPSFARIGTIAGLALSAAAGLAGAGAFAALRRPLPRTTGRLPLPGLSAPVEVLRDSWGVPHIYAASNHDLFAAQGYVHAQERLWQMEFNRRLGSGRLAEILGPLALDTDRFVRILGFGRVSQYEASQLPAETRQILEAYVHGVNAFLTQHRTRLPIEFTLLRFSPQPWQVADILVWTRMMALNLSANWGLELLRARIVATVGPERAALLDPCFPADHPLTIPPEARYSADMGASIPAGVTLAGMPGPQTGQGSNAWAVSGTRTTSGKPLLADDPHLSITTPSIWFENHLEGGDFYVTGVSFPGAPGVVIGHNRQIAWGLTNVCADVQDVFIERFDPNDPTRYEFQGQWLRAETVDEVIQIKGHRAPHIETVRITRHGPVITPLAAAAAPTNNEALALRWTALEPMRITSAVFKLNRAHDWASFRAALADWTCPPQNFVYADTAGHIGYSVGGAMPLRAKGDGKLPVPGWAGEYEWEGFIPNADLPHILDPDEGFVVTANNRIVGDDYPYSFQGEWLNGYRAIRIRELLGQTARHNAGSFASIHGDLRSRPGLELAALAERLPTVTPLARQAQAILAAWDGELRADSVAGLIYTRLRQHLVAIAYAEASAPLELKTGLGAFAGLPQIGYLNRAAPEVLRRCATHDDAWLPAGRTWDAALSEAWAATLADLQAEFGPNPTAWQYGRWHKLTFRHPLSVVPGLARLLNRGPFALGGDADTVCNGDFPRQTAGLPLFIAPSYRQIIDTADWDRSLSIHPGGQSGHPASRQYDDFIASWRQVQYHPMLWKRERVEAATAARLRLEPA